MSGFDEISAWAFDEYDIEEYDDFDRWYDAVSFDFETEGRNSLDNILDSAEKDKLEEMFNDQKESGKFDKQEIQTEIDDFNLKQEEEKAEIELKEKEDLEKPFIQRTIIEPVKRFFSRLFGR